MFRTVIIEDESLAAKRLEVLIKRYHNSIEIVAKLPSIKHAVQWFLEHPMPDLVFMDIHLEDGLSFAITEQVQITSPVILTTAFDDELIKAFKAGYFACLLKPINKDDLAAALDKFRQKFGFLS